MMVDDHRLIRESIKSLIENETNIEIIGEAGTGEEAVRMAQELKPDVILTDFNMPLMNGIEASREITHENPGIKILLMSTALTIHIIERALEAGILGLMSKTSVADELIDAIDTVQKNHKFCCPKVIQMQKSVF